MGVLYGLLRDTWKLGYSSYRGIMPNAFCEIELLGNDIFPEMRGPSLGPVIIRMNKIGGLTWGSPYSWTPPIYVESFGNCPAMR